MALFPDNVSVEGQTASGRKEKEFWKCKTFSPFSEFFFYKFNRKNGQIHSDVENNIRVFHLSDLLNEDNIRDAWLAPFVKVWKPGTAKSYLGSLSLFLDFLTTRKVVDQTTLSSVLATIKRLQRSLRKRALQARTAQETEDMGKMFSLVYEKCILDICT